MQLTKLFLFASLVMVFAIGCSDSDKDNVLSPSISTGVLKILLTDAPGDYDEVNITFSEVAVHPSGDTDIDGEDNTDSEGDGDGDEVTPKIAAGESWIVIESEPQTIDLLTLSNGLTSVLGEEELEAGHYTQLRIVIIDAEVVVDGESHELTIPSGTLKFIKGFDIDPDGLTELVVDFDASRSIHTTGKNRDYKLKPTIRVTTNAVCGAIGGIVTNFENEPVAYAIAGADTVTSSIVDSETGAFKLGFLEEGGYTVAVTDTLGLAFSADNVQVSTGIKNDLGAITLE